jgi:hypothetical protein
MNARKPVPNRRIVPAARAAPAILRRRRDNAAVVPPPKTGVATLEAVAATLAQVQAALAGLAQLAPAVKPPSEPRKALPPKRPWWPRFADSTQPSAPATDHTLRGGLNNMSEAIGKAVDKRIVRECESLVEAIGMALNEERKDFEQKIAELEARLAAVEARDG